MRKLACIFFLLISFGAVSRAETWNPKDDPPHVKAVAALDAGVSADSIGNTWLEDPPPATSPGAAVAVPAPAVVPPAVDSDPVGFAQKLYRSVRSGDWLPFVGGLLIFLTWLARKVFPTLKGAGATVLAGALAGLGALGTAWWAGQSFDTKQFLTAAAVWLGAMGGWSGGKALLAEWLLPKLRGLFKKA